MADQLITQLPERLEQALAQALRPGETVFVKLKGNFAEALVCTTTRVMIIKAGLMTGQLFGTNVFQASYAAIAGIEVKFSLLSGYFELSTAGMQNTDKNYWSRQENRSPAKAPNCVSLANRRQANAFNAACTFIMEKLAEARNPAAPAPVPVPSEPQGDVLAMLERLGKMKDSGILSADEFNLKKQELLSRL